jgi:hypothetical protein
VTANESDSRQERESATQLKTAQAPRTCKATICASVNTGSHTAGKNVPNSAILFLKESLGHLSHGTAGTPRRRDRKPNHRASASSAPVLLSEPRDSGMLFLFSLVYGSKK